MTDALRHRMALAMTEDDLLLVVAEAARYLGWRWTHVRRSDQALTMGHTGFPDLVLARGGRILFLELKSQHGHLTTDQVKWLDDLAGRPATWRTATPWTSRLVETAGVRVLVIRPSDLDDLLELLK